MPGALAAAPQPKTDAGAGAGMGGAIFNHTGSVSCVNSTLYGNVAQGGDAPNATGGSGLGGAIFNVDGTVTLPQCTLDSNQVIAGSGGTNGSAAGGAIYNRRQDPGITGYGFTYPAASITLMGTILADSIDGASAMTADCNWQLERHGLRRRHQQRL